MCTYPLPRSRRVWVPPLRRLTFEQRKSKQNALAPPLGTSPRLGMPAVRHCSVGPPRSAIHGRVAATPASCRGAHCAIPACGHRGFTGRLRSKARSTATPEREAAFPCGSGGATIRLARECGGSVMDILTDTPHSRASPLPQGGRARIDDQAGCQAASLCL